MAVYERGYRTYHGGFHGRPGWTTILREGYRVAWQSKGFRFVCILFLIWFVIWGAVLYNTLGIDEATRELRAARRGRDLLAAPVQLRWALGVFYGGVSALSGLAALLLGAGLVSDDLRTRALPLYLVRPIHARDYVLGKALVLPAAFFWICLLPGLLYYLLVGMWQPPGETAAFLSDNVAIVENVVRQYLFAAMAYTGLMLTLSCRTPRRGAVFGIGAAVLFVGTMFGLMAGELEGTWREAFRYVGIPFMYEAGFARDAAIHQVQDATVLAETLEWLPDPNVSIWIAAALFGLGLFTAWRRARTVEVTS